MNPLHLLSRRAVPSALNRVRERRLGVDTAGMVDLAQLGLPEENRVWHAPTDWFSLTRALGKLRIGPEDVFIDFGSGKGRVIMAAARRPFRRVIGVELSEELTAVARSNLKRARAAPRCGALELVVSDVLDYDVPDDATVVYLFNPFTGPVFATLFDKLRASLERRPRPVRMLYSHPFEHEYVMVTGSARVIDATPARWPPWSLNPAEVIVTYLLLAPGEPVPDLDRLLAKRRDHRLVKRWQARSEFSFELGPRFERARFGRSRPTGELVVPQAESPEVKDS